VRPLLLRLAALVLAGALGASARSARPVIGGASGVDAVGCVGVTVQDLRRSVTFYTRVLAFREEREDEEAGAAWEAVSGVFALRTRTARLRLGAECLEVTEYLGPKGRPFPADARSNDRSFQHVAIVVSDMDRAYARLRAAVYRDALGLRVAGGSENEGDEQAHLNGVEGAHLRITTLRASRGPGVELLEYLAPRDGRPYPPDARPNDLVHWQTTLRVPALGRASGAALAAGGTLASRAPADLSPPAARPGLGRALLVRDPDGHALLVVEPRPAALATMGAQAAAPP
jgi:catechol 2,3-dioxygenase-like lactoylglutathione lyase family enzyme